jgi:hypothetical protein
VLELLGMLVAAIGCALGVRLLLSQMQQIPGLLLAIPVGALVYFVLVRLLGAVPASDMAHPETLLGGLPQALKVSLHQALSLIGTSRAA